MKLARSPSLVVAGVQGQDGAQSHPQLLLQTVITTTTTAITTTITTTTSIPQLIVLVGGVRLGQAVGHVHVLPETLYVTYIHIYIIQK